MTKWLLDHTLWLAILGGCLSIYALSKWCNLKDKASGAIYARRRIKELRRLRDESLDMVGKLNMEIKELSKGG